jgi:hypothetical protein
MYLYHTIGIGYTTFVFGSQCNSHLHDEGFGGEGVGDGAREEGGDLPECGVVGIFEGDVDRMVLAYDI